LKLRSYLLNSNHKESPHKTPRSEAVRNSKARVLFWALATIKMTIDYKYKKLVEISIASIMVFLITDKVCHILTEIAVRVMAFNNVENSFVFISLLLLILALSVWLFISLFKYFIQKGNNNSVSLWILIGSYFLLIAAFILLNTISAKLWVANNELPPSINDLGNYGYSKAIPKLLFLGAIGYLLLISRNKTVANIK